MMRLWAVPVLLVLSAGATVGASVHAGSMVVPDFDEVLHVPSSFVPVRTCVCPTRTRAVPTRAAPLPRAESVPWFCGAKSAGCPDFAAQKRH